MILLQKSGYAWVDYAKFFYIFSCIPTIFTALTDT